MKALLAVAAAATAMALPATALAYTDTGQTVWGNGHPCSGCNVYIHNYTTGANGSTTTNGSGNYSFGGLVAGSSYSVYTAYFGIPGCSYTSPSYFWTQSAQDTGLPVQTMGGPNPTGCPQYPQ